MKKLSLILIILISLTSCGDKSSSGAPAVIPIPDQGNVGNVEGESKKDCELKLVKELLELEKKLRLNIPSSSEPSTEVYSSQIDLINQKLVSLAVCK